jgi:broad specificity phosphatase PhoE
MILIRHGQSEWNAAYNRTRVDPGIPDPPLTAVGRDQALRAAELLAEQRMARLLVSPYRRTIQTAEIIARELALPMVIEPLVRERAAFSCDVGTARTHLVGAWPHLRFDHLDEVWWPARKGRRSWPRCDRFAITSAADRLNRVAVISIGALSGIDRTGGPAMVKPWPRSPRRFREEDVAGQRAKAPQLAKDIEPPSPPCVSRARQTIEQTQSSA